MSAAAAAAAAEKKVDGYWIEYVRTYLNIKEN